MINKEEIVRLKENKYYDKIAEELDKFRGEYKFVLWYFLPDLLQELEEKKNNLPKETFRDNMILHTISNDCYNVSKLHDLLGDTLWG